MSTTVQIGDILCHTSSDAPPDEWGVTWHCGDVEGWGSPASTLEVTQRAWGDGGWGGASHLAPRVMGVKGSLSAPTAAAARDALDRLYVAVGLDDTPLVVTESGLARMCMVRRQDDVLPTWLNECEVEWSAQVVALDPLRYSAVEHSVTLGLPSTSGGLTVPVTVPVTVNAVVTSGRRTIVNAGSKPSGLRLRVDGPVMEPRVSLLTPAGTAIVRVRLTVETGQWLDIDTAARTVYLNGTASRRGLTSVDGAGWPVLPAAGFDAEVAFDAAAYSSSALLTCSWRDSWQ